MGYSNKSLILFVYYHLTIEDLESFIAEYQQYNVFNFLRKWKILTHYQDPVIYTTAFHQHSGIGIDKFVYGIGIYQMEVSGIKFEIDKMDLIPCLLQSKLFIWKIS